MGGNEMEKEVILLIEDDADIREGVRILLESEGYAVQEAQIGCDDARDIRHQNLRGNPQTIVCTGAVSDGKVSGIR